MFFKTSDFSVNNISAYELTWKEHEGDSAVRPYHALSFRVVGDAIFTYGQDAVKAVTGDILFVPAYRLYHLATGSERLFVIHFYSDKTLSERIQKFTPQTAGVYRQCFEAITDAWSKKETGYEHECKYLLYKIIMNIEREFDRKALCSHGDEMQKALAYIHANFTDRELSVQKLAGYCSMSETYFRKLFMKTNGCAPLAYINKLRLEYAVQLLETKYYTVGEVSDKCGFSTPYYFSAFIKRKTGHSPVEFIK